jgi:hypothetical protein
VAAGAQLPVGAAEVRAKLAEWEAVDARPEGAGPRCHVASWELPSCLG